MKGIEVVDLGQDCRALKPLKAQTFCEKGWARPRLDWSRRAGPRLAPKAHRMLLPFLGAGRDFASRQWFRRVSRKIAELIPIASSRVRLRESASSPPRHQQAEPCLKSTQFQKFVI
jgi:hypothetical protein